MVELTVRDFTSFWGVHSFRFCGGFNLVQGSGGSGKTNLVRSLEFALFGRTRDQPVSSLINDLHRGDCEKWGATPSCEVSAVFRCGGRDFMVKRKLLDCREGLKQIMVFDSDVIDIVSPESFEKMFIREQDIEPLGGLSLGESTPIIVLNALARNIYDGISMVFLDDVFGRLANEAKIELLARLNNFGLEQIIVFESFVFEKALLEEYESKFMELPCARTDHREVKASFFVRHREDNFQK